MPLEIPEQGRRLAGSGARIGEGEYVVYHFVAKTFVRCTPEGEALTGRNEMGCVFENLTAARRYCQWKAAENPKLGCTVYDSQGKVAEQIFNNEYAAKVERANAPKRQFILGWLLLMGGGLLIWLDARHDWVLMIGFLVGVRLAVGGAAKLLLSLEGLFKKRSA